MKIKQLIGLVCLFSVLATAGTGCSKKIRITLVRDNTSYQHDSDNTANYSGKVYYVSNQGDDSNDGLSPQTAFKTIGKVNSLELSAGDAILFQCGGVYDDACLTIKNSGTTENHIYISYYGTGEYPVVRGGLDKDEQYLLSENREASCAIKIASAYNVTIDGLHLDGANFGIFLNNAKKVNFTDSQLKINDCIFTNIEGYHCLSLQETAPNIPPFYSNAIEVGLRGQEPLYYFEITNCKFFDCDAAMHIDTNIKTVMRDVLVDNMYREGVLFESAKAREDDPSTITNVVIRNVGTVYGKDWGTAGLQFNVCSNFICDNLDISYTGNAEFKNDMVGGDFEATNRNMVLKNSRIHNNGGEGWLIYRTPGWGMDNRNLSIINCRFENNGLKDDSTAAFLRHFYNEQCGGEIKGNRISLAYEGQKLNFIDEENTNEYPQSYDISDNTIDGVYKAPKIDLPKNSVCSFEFDQAYDYSQWYAFENARYSYQNGMYLTTRLDSSNDGEAVIISKKHLGLDLSKQNKLQIRIKNKTKATVMRIYFADEKGNFGDKYLTIPIEAMNNGFVEYTVPIDSMKLSKVDRIKILPAVGASEGWLQYDYIRFIG